MSDARRSHWPITILSTFASAVNLFLPLILVRLLSQKDVGTYKTFFLYLTDVFPAVSLTWGVQSGIAYWAGRERERGEALPASADLFVVSGVACTLAAVAMRGVLADRIGLSDDEALVFAVSVFGTVTGPFFEEAAIATGRVWTGALFLSSFEVVRTLCVLASAVYFRDVTAVVTAHAVLVTAKAVLGLLMGARLGLVRPLRTPRVYGEVLRYALPVAVAGACMVFVGRVDLLILSDVLSKEDFALYSIGCLTLQPLYIFEHSVTRVLVPQLSAEFSAERSYGAAGLFRDAVSSLSFLLVPAVAGLVVYARPIIELLFTPRYAAGAAYLELYAFTYLFLLIPYDTVARARGESRWILGTVVRFAVFSALLAGLMTYLLGPFGTLGAVLVTGFAMRAYAMRHVAEVTGWALRDFLPFETIARHAAVSISLAVVSAAAAPLFRSGFVWFVVTAPAFMIAYFVLTYLFRPRSHGARRGPLRVVHVVQSLRIGGIERMVTDLALSSAGDGTRRVAVFAYDHPEGEDDFVPALTAAGVPLDVRRKGRGFSCAAVVALARAVTRHHADVIHCHDLGGLIYGSLAKVACGGRPVLVMTQHSFIHLARKSRYRTYEKIFTRFAECVTVVSDEVKGTYLELGVPAGRVEVVRSGVRSADRPGSGAAGGAREEVIAARRALAADLAAPDLASPGRCDAVWLLYLARFHPGKGQDRFLDVWRAASPEVRGASVVLFVGPDAYPGERARIEALARGCPDADRLCFLGAAPDPGRFLSVSDVFVSTSESEGLPLAPAEAVCSGLAAFLSDIPGHATFAPFAVMARPDVPAGAAEALGRLVATCRADPEGEAGRRRRAAAPLREIYSIEAMAARYERVYATAAGTADAAGEAARGAPAGAAS